MQNQVLTDRALRRVTVRAEGQWTIDQADRWYRDMVDILSWASDPREPITIFADLDGLILHTAAVSRRVEESVRLMERFAIRRYALVVPSFLNRMQTRRLLAGVAHSYFDDRESAQGWLGWTPPGIMPHPLPSAAIAPDGLRIGGLHG